jgi:serine protease inhibitor
MDIFMRKVCRINLLKKCVVAPLITVLILQFLPPPMVRADKSINQDFIYESNSSELVVDKEEEGYMDFSFDLFSKVAVNGDENPLISPASAYFALAMVANGASKNTKKAFEDVLGMSIDELNISCKKLLKNLQVTKGDTILNIADSIWAKKGFPIQTNFVEQLKSYYDAKIYLEDLTLEDTKNKINSWVANKTNQLIPILLDEPLSDETIMLLINTIYMKAKWEQEFSANDTYDRVFYKEDGSNLKVPFLNSSKTRKYFSDNNTEGILLPYNDEKLVFVALRPTNGEKVNEFAKGLTADSFKDYQKSAKNMKVKFAMPKFTLDYTLIMNDILCDMGLSVAFDYRKADFSKIANNLFISKVLQKTKIEVNEQGTEAAAVTSIELSECSYIEEEVEFILDSPYVYAIIDKESGLPLFIGIMNNPK